MPYKPEYLTNLNNVIQLVAQSKISEALADFENYFSGLDIGPYSIMGWPPVWRREVYDFGRLFDKDHNNDAGQFIQKINEALEAKKFENGAEAIQFIRSEIIWNYFPLEEGYSSNILKSLIKQYPGNPEFRQSYSHFLESSGNYTLSVEESCLAFKIEPSNDDFYANCFNKCKHYFDVLLSKGKLKEADNMIKKMQEIVKKRKDVAFNNVIVSLKDRLGDHKIISERIEGIKEIAKDAVEKERGRIIEIMGFFVAILGFVFININLATSSLEFKEILLLMLGMGIVLSFFATLISILFHEPEKFIKDPRFWLLASLIITFIIFTECYR